ncbi:DUF1003 domain-containing protein [Kocuria aegyptia]
MLSISARRVPEETWHEKHQQDLTRGERAADRLRNLMGNWWFVAGFILFMAGWAVANSFGAGWDPYPYILLNLFLSMLAGLQGAILLIAAKRQDAISSALAQHDYDTNVAAKIDIDTVLEINQRQLEMIGELQEVVRRLDPARLDAAGRADAQEPGSSLDSPAP